MTPLRTVLSEDIKLRGYAESTQKTYFTNVNNFIVRAPRSAKLT